MGVMRYGIVGSRSRTDRQSVVDFVRTLEPGDTVVSGGCRGVDTWAVDEAKNRGLETVEYLPDLSACKARHEFTKAYHARNELIAKNCDVLVAFVSAERKGGTENAIKHAGRMGRPVKIIPPPSA